MVISRSFRLGAAHALATLVAVAWIVGCGGAGGSRSGGSVADKADAVEVIYYYLPG